MEAGREILPLILRDVTGDKLPPPPAPRPPPRPLPPGPPEPTSLARSRPAALRNTRAFATWTSKKKWLYLRFMVHASTAGWLSQDPLFALELCRCI